MWFAQAKVIEERRSICSSCKFAVRESTGLWCGTPKYKSFKGDIVTYRKKKYQLCGCNMFLKTGFKNQSCPVGKWSSVGSLNEDDKNEIRAFLKTVNTDYISQEDLKKLYDYATKASGQWVEPSKCSPCIKDLLTKLKNDVE